MTTDSMIHLATSHSGFIVDAPRISRDGHLIAMNGAAGSGAAPSFFIDPSIQGHAGAVLIDLASGKARMIGPASAVLDPTADVLGLSADGGKVLLYADPGALLKLPDDLFKGQPDSVPHAVTFTAAIDGGGATLFMPYALPDGKTTVFSLYPDFSADGNHVLVEGTMFGGTTMESGVFEINTATGTVTPVAHSAGPDATVIEGENPAASQLGLSADGRIAVYDSLTHKKFAEELQRDLYAFDTSTGQRLHVDALPDDHPGNNASFSFSVSGNGRYVAFDTWATNLLPGQDINNRGQVLVKDLSTGALLAASADSHGQPSQHGASSGKGQAISDDGRYVVFQSEDAYGFSALDGLKGPARLGFTHAFVKDMVTGALALVNATPETIGLDVRNVAISGDGGTIVFQAGSAVDAQGALTYETYATALPKFTPAVSNDTLKGTAGADSLAGGLGDDNYVVDNWHDVVVEYADAGRDTVHASHTYTLPANVEDLVLDGTVAIDGTGNGLANRLDGTAAANRLAGGAGDDVIAGHGGADTIDGGDGVDTVRIDGALAAYRIVGGSQTVVHERSSNSETVLTSVERLQFDDAVVTFDTGGVNGQMYRLYQAAFDRTPDPGGLGFWLYQREHGASPASVSADFVKSDEFVRLFGAQASNEHLVDGLYQHVLHRAPDAGGKAYWIDLLDRHVVDSAYVLERFSESPENVAAVIGVMQNGIAYVPYGG